MNRLLSRAADVKQVDKIFGNSRGPAFLPVSRRRKLTNSMAMPGGENEVHRLAHKVADAAAGIRHEVIAISSWRGLVATDLVTTDLVTTDLVTTDLVTTDDQFQRFV